MRYHTYTYTLGVLLFVAITAIFFVPIHSHAQELEGIAEEFSEPVGEASGEATLLFFEIKHQADVFDVNISCIEQDIESFETVKDNLLSSGNPGGPLGLPTQARLENQLTNASYAADLSGWVQVIPEYMDEVSALNAPPTKYIATAVLQSDILCETIQNYTLELGHDTQVSTPLSGHNPASIPVSVMGDLGFSGMGPTAGGDTCFVIKKKTSPLREYSIVFIGDAGFYQIVNGEGQWNGGKISHDEIMGLIRAYGNKILEHGFPGSWEQVGIYFLKTDVNYTECEMNCNITCRNRCSFPKVLNHAVQGCGLNQGEHVNAYLLHGISYTGSRSGVLGYAFLNSRALTILVGVPHRMHLQSSVINLTEKAKNELKRFSLNQIINDVIFHERGHQEDNLDHTNGNIGNANNSPYGLIFDQKQTCEQTSRGECERLPFGKYVVVTRASPSIGTKFGYMSAVADIDLLPLSGSSYQEWGHPHLLENVIPHNLKQKGFLPDKPRVCGDGVVQAGEDTDVGAPIQSSYQVGFQTVHVASCANVADPREEIRLNHPVNVLNNQTQYERFLSFKFARDSLYSNQNSTPNRVSLDTVSCQLNIPCIDLNQPPSLGLAKNPKLIPPQGFKSVSAVDCQNIDYRFKAGREFENFENQHCNYSSANIDRTKSIYEEQTNNIIASWIKTDHTANQKWLKFALLAEDGAIISAIKSKTLNYNDKVLALTGLELSAQQRSDGYNPIENHPDYLNKLRHPVIPAIMVTDRRVDVWAMKPKFTDGLDDTQPRYSIDVFNQVGQPIQKVIDISFYKPKLEAVVTVMVNGGAVYELRFQTNQVAGAPAAVKTYDNITNLLRGQNRFVGVGPDSKTLFSVGDKNQADHIELIQDPLGAANPEYIRQLGVGYSFAPDLRHSDMIVTKDNLNRYVFVWTERGNFPKSLKFVHAPLTAWGGRKDGEVHVTNLVGTINQYSKSSGQRPEVQFNKEGYLYAVHPFVLDKKLVVTDPYAQATFKLPFKPLNTPNADQGGLFALELLDNTIMVNTQFGIVADTTDTRLGVLARTEDQNGTQTTLYLQKDQAQESFDKIILDSDSNTNVEFSNFSLVGTGAGPDASLRGELGCEENDLGLLADLTGRVWDEMEDYFLVLDGTSTSTTFKIYWAGSDKVYGTSDDQHVFTKTMQHSNQILQGGAQLFYPVTSNGGLTVNIDEAGPLIYWLVEEPITSGFAWFSYEINTITGSVKKSQAIANPPTQFGDHSIRRHLVERKLYTTTLENKLFVCDVMTCTHTEVSAFPEPRTDYWENFVGNGAIAFMTSQGTYIHDTHGFHSYRAIDYMKQIDKETYELVYDGPSGKVLDTVKTVGGIKSIQKLSVEASFDPQDKIIGQLRVGNTDILGVYEDNRTYAVKLRSNNPVKDATCATAGHDPYLELKTSDSKSAYFYTHDRGSQKIKVYRAFKK